MGWHHRPRLQRVEHPLRLVRGRISQVHVHPQPWRGLGLGGEGIKECFIYYHTTSLLPTKSYGRSFKLNLIKQREANP